jgi:diaminobutyrate-2-oxoglutarate transaminase
VKPFEQHESNVRSYIRDFPTVFAKAKGYRLWDEQGREYIDFFAGAGALNYGHNPDRIMEPLIDYIRRDGVVHSLDMATSAKADFIETFHETILAPRGMDHKLLFPGPTGTNSVESAIKIARLTTGRSGIVCFTNAFHGMTLGSLALTGNATKREGAGVPLHGTFRMPFDGYLGKDVDTLDYLVRTLDDNGSGVDLPAAVIVETLQGEGGLNVASFEWLQRLEAICRQHGIVLIVDDIQAGCGRTGTFFSFEPARLDPDIVCLSKSISGSGLPMALTLLKPHLDCFSPGQHNGTFRGNNLAFVTATQALKYWQDGSFERSINAKAAKVETFLTDLVNDHPQLCGVVAGRGLMQGIKVGVDGLAGEICQHAFRMGLLMETSGADGEVVKVMPPLVIEDVGLEKGLSILAKATAAALDSRRSGVKHVA